MHMVYYRGWSVRCINFLLIPPVQHLFPEKLSRCQWLPVVSDAVVKCPFVRLTLATITMAVIIVLAVFNLVRFHTLCAKRRGCYRDRLGWSQSTINDYKIHPKHTWHYTQK